MAINFGAGTNVIDTDSAIDPPAEGTIAFWINLTALSTWRPIGFHDSWEIRGVSGKIYNDFYRAGGTPGLVLSATLTTGVLYHLACTWDYAAGSVAQQIYLDGLLDGSTSHPGADPGSGVTEIGRARGQDPINAIMSDLRMYNRVLSANEIATIHAAKGVDGIAYGLVHRWVMRGPEGGSVGAVKDWAGNIDCATSVGTPTYTGDGLKLRRAV